MNITDMPWGPDVSKWKPVTDWHALATSGATFFAAKATEGAHTVDPTFTRHRDGFRAFCSGFAMGVWYHFLRLEKSPEDQAENLAAAIGEMRVGERICCDFEGKSYAAVEKATVRQHGLEFIERFYARAEALGLLAQRGLIYTSAQHWDVLGDPDWMRAPHLDLWTPRYNPQGLEPKRLPRPWERWTIFQFTDGDDGIHREVPGVGLCDCSVLAPPF